MNGSSMSAQEQAGETEVLLDSSAATITRIENALFGPVPSAVNSTVGPKGLALMGLLEDNRVKLNGLLSRLQIIEQALVSTGLKAVSNIR
jgi:hypothetical protein